MTHHHYAFDRVFSAEDGNEEVYAAVRPLVHWACKGMGATLICYGQTGTGACYAPSHYNPYSQHMASIRFVATRAPLVYVNMYVLGILLLLLYCIRVIWVLL